VANIPKKVADRFSKSIPKFQKVLKIAKDRDVNESDTVSILKDILSEVFGYDKYLEVTGEFAIRGTYCDLAIKIDDKVQFLVEVKAIGIDLKEIHMRQALEYGANHGIQWIVLSNGIQWQLYRIRFEKPINYDLVYSFDFTDINPRGEKDRESLFLISKEGLAKNAREKFYEKVQSVNRFIIGVLILSEPTLSVLRRELRKFSDGVKIDINEIKAMVRSEVLKRELVEGEEAEAAQAKVKKFYRKGRAHTKKQEKSQTPASSAQEDVSFSDKLLQES
jgi:predicted type IV restriction endonuclease